MLNTYDTESIHGLTVRYVYDENAEMPWEMSDGHGPVRYSAKPHTEQQSNKHPGERPLNQPTRNERQYYYNWAEACKLARVDGWHCEPYDAPNRIQRAVQADFDYLRAYLRGDWQYIGVIITDKDGKHIDSMWGIESFNDHHKEHAREMIADIFEQKRLEWRAALHEARERKYWATRDVLTA